MNRSWIRIVVFCGLLGTAGYLWGMAETRMFAASALLDHSQTATSVPWVFPACAALLVIAFSLAAWMARRDIWKSVEVLIPVLMFLGVGFLAASIPYTADDPGSQLAHYTGFGVLFLCMALVVAFALHYRRIRRRTPVSRITAKDAVIILVLLTMTVALGYFVSASDDPAVGINRMFSFGGLSLPLVCTVNNMTSLDLTSMLAFALMSGSLAGGWFGLFLSSLDNRRAVSIILVSAVFGAVISAILFAAHAVMLLRLYDVAWDIGTLLPTALLVWTACGLLFGLMLSFMVRVLNTEQHRKPQAVKASLAVLGPVLLVAYATAFMYVRGANGGLPLLQRAAQLGGYLIDVGFLGLGRNADHQARPSYQIIAPGSRGRIAQASDESRGSATIALCGQLLRRYPRSAYRSAALFVQFQCLFSEWRPAESLDAFSSLQQRYPHHRYDPLDALSSFRVLDLMATGRYKDVVLVMRSSDNMPLKHTVSMAGARAAETLGLWDDAVKARKQLLDEYARTRNPRKDWLEKYRANLDHAQHMKAVHATPMPLTNVAGRVLLSGKGADDVAVCLVPTGKLPQDPKEINFGWVVIVGGRLERTRPDGTYSVHGIPSGRYDVVLVLGPSARQYVYTVHAPGVPYDIRGKSVRLPDIMLTAEPGK